MQPTRRGKSASGDCLAQMVNSLPPPSSYSEAPLVRLRQNLYGSKKRPKVIAIEPKQRQKFIDAAARETIPYLPPLEALLEQRDRWNEYRERIIASWPEAEFRNRMLLREMVIHIERYQSLFSSLEKSDQDAFIAALEPSGRERFIIQQEHNRRMVADIKPLVLGDPEVSSSITSEEVWNIIKQADPKAEEAFSKPLDESKYVERDFKRTPRRSA
jgi:hypothetical protein